MDETPAEGLGRKSGFWPMLWATHPSRGLATHGCYLIYQVTFEIKAGFWRKSEISW